MKGDARIPISTYRLQLNKNFPFKSAESLVDYFSDLGISDIYLSPILRAHSGSLHGYDGVDTSQISPELGGRQGFESLFLTVKKKKIGLLLDIVPNHVATSDENAKWNSVLEYGRFSPYASFFDIDWSSRRNPKNKVFLPILADSWEKSVQSEKVRIYFDQKNSRIFLKIYENRRLPLCPGSYAAILKLCAEELSRDERQIKLLKKLDTLTRSFSALPSSVESHFDNPSLYKTGEKLKRRFQNLCALTPKIPCCIHKVLRDLDRSIVARKRILGLILNEQFYVIGQIIRDSAKINYRRFFEVSDLIGVRVEDPKIFAETHKLILELLDQKKISGLRVDHPDGLLDPTAYFRRLQASFGSKIINPPLFVLAEKILMEQEHLNQRWKVYGTTGYDFARDSTQLFVYPSGLEFDAIYQKFIRKRTNFDTAVHLGKRKVLRKLMQAELIRVSDLLYSISRKTNQYRNLNSEAITRALEEVVSRFPVYRTYVTEKTAKLSNDEAKFVLQALDRAKHVDTKSLRLLRQLLFLEKVEGVPFREARNFVMKFQQLTGPIMAKGVEDTAFYTFNRLISLNEVGGNPERFGISIEEFHLRNQLRAKTWPYTMLCSSTHDTKRSEDVRARINFLSEIPEEWHKALVRWNKLNKEKKTFSNGKFAPGRNDEYFLYQTLLGAWPLTPSNGTYDEFIERIVAYERKASKEAKENTSWQEPNEKYDLALERFVRKILEKSSSNKFLKDFGEFQSEVSFFGMLNSLSSLLLKLTSPGFPDIYQGNEIWDFSLVDPDNRRKVDFLRIKRMQSSLSAMLKKMDCDMLSARLLRNWKDGFVKMYVLNLTLRFRSSHPNLFFDGEYLPLKTVGEKQDHLCAFLRQNHHEKCLVIVPRFFSKLTGEPRSPLGKETWGNTRILLPDKSRVVCYNLFTRESLSSHEEKNVNYLHASEVFDKFPIALLTTTL